MWCCNLFCFFLLCFIWFVFVCYNCYATFTHSRTQSMYIIVLDSYVTIFFCLFLLQQFAWCLYYSLLLFSATSIFMLVLCSFVVLVCYMVFVGSHCCFLSVFGVFIWQMLLVIVGFCLFIGFFFWPFCFFFVCWFLSVFVVFDW